MKTNISVLMIVAAAGLGLAACNKSPEAKQADAVENNANATANAMKNQADVVEKQGENAGDAMTTSTENKADAIRDQADTVKKEGEAQADAIKDTKK